MSPESRIRESGKQCVPSPHGETAVDHQIHRSDAAHSRRSLRQPLSCTTLARACVPDEDGPVLREFVEFNHGRPALRAGPILFHFQGQSVPRVLVFLKEPHAYHLPDRCYVVLP